MMPSLNRRAAHALLADRAAAQDALRVLRATEAAPDDQRLTETIERLADDRGGQSTAYWTVEGDQTASQAIRRVRPKARYTLEVVVRDPIDRARQLACVPLVLQNEKRVEILPELSSPLRPGDQILFCGDSRAYRMLDSTLHNEYALRYIITGRDEPRGWVMQWLTRRYPRLQGRRAHYPPRKPDGNNA